MNTTQKKNYVMGALILSLGALLSKFLGMFFKIPITNIIGDYGMGLYGYAYPLYSTLLTVSTAGLPGAVSKMVSECVAQGDYKKSYKIFYIAFVTLALFGIAASVTMFAGAKTFIKLFSWDENAYYSIVAISASPFFVCLISAVRGFFQGMQNMTHTSISQLIEQIGRVVCGVSLSVYLMNTRGVAFAAAGASFGAVAGGVAAFIYLYIAFGIYQNKHKNDFVSIKPNKPTESTRSILKRLILIAVPLMLSSVVNTLMDLINSITISNSLRQIGYSASKITDLYGQMTSKAQTLVNVPLVIGVSLSASLVPAISESIIKNDKQKAKQKSTLAIKLSLLLALPASIGLCILAEPIIALLFSKASSGHEMLSLLSPSIIFCVTMSCMQGILQGAGHYISPLVNMTIGGIIKLMLNIVLVKIPTLNIYGAIISTIAATFVIATLNFISVKKYVGIDSLIKPIGKIILSCVIMTIVCIFSYKALLYIVSFKIAVIISILLSIATYALSIIITNAITLEDVYSVRS